MSCSLVLRVFAHVVGLTVLCHSTIVRAQEGADPEREWRMLRNVLQSDASPRQCGDAYRRALTSERSELQTDDANDGIALHAAWATQLHAAKIPEPRTSFFELDRTSVFGASYVGVIGSEGLSRFLAFVAERMRVDVPGWWEWSLRHNAITANRRLSFVGFRPPFERARSLVAPPISIEIPKTTLVAFGQLSTVAVGEDLSITDGDQQVKVSMSTLREYCVGKERCAIAIAKGKLYFAFFEDVPNAFDLCCLDVMSGDVVWQTRVWALDLATHTPGGTTGSADHIATITVKDGRVLVWGGDGRGMYFEAFDDLGKAQCRFSTNLWSTFDTITFADENGLGESKEDAQSVTDSGPNKESLRFRGRRRWTVK